MRAAQAADELAHSHLPLPVSGGVYQVIEDALVHAEQGSVVVQRWGGGGKEWGRIGEFFCGSGGNAGVMEKDVKGGSKGGSKEDRTQGTEEGLTHSTGQGLLQAGTAFVSGGA